MPSKIRRLAPVLRLNERVLGPVRYLARMAGVSPAEIIEFLLEEILEGDVAALVPPAPPAPPRRRAAVIPITRARRGPTGTVGVDAFDLHALRQGAEQVRHRAQEARRDAAAACDAADAARERAANALALGREAAR
jgi:hypothetical protein